MKSDDSKATRAAFGTVLSETRQRLGLSQETLAFESGLHRTYISQLERGLKAPTLDTLFALSKALGVSPHELVAQVESRGGDAGEIG